MVLIMEKVVIFHLNDDRNHINKLLSVLLSILPVLLTSLIKIINFNCF